MSCLYLPRLITIKCNSLLEADELNEIVQASGHWRHVEEPHENDAELILSEPARITKLGKQIDVLVQQDLSLNKSLTYLCVFHTKNMNTNRLKENGRSLLCISVSR